MKNPIRPNPMSVRPGILSTTSTKWKQATPCFHARPLSDDPGGFHKDSNSSTKNQDYPMTFLDCAVSRFFVRVSLAGLVLLALAFPQHRASAETKYPNKAVRIVLPFAAGGVADI